ncbi:MAG: hypothetical protein LKE46_16950 [Clostridium sp.]|jgi:hypothetical protein|uniref:hypothetical protein n=1 Tax=Clostridium sp. TaxID=1506 RepID=UPI0025C33563|nr:hypothetical protein [Clostridium sp.]MCH3965905.1 hypothetical protein [Clostridium sp.]MCI1716006.1 hypothetical protein [Clostridium sp.]MCI1800322.1 hypothetical protein [Clostridium sp.]MCI1814183.1 hypothetical protein [Clostridium sp.]MCI1871082.1 hypothetical protein [Clostridium sp.]
MVKSYNKVIFPKLSSKDSFRTFLIIFILELAGGIYLGYFKGILLNDAFSRTANTFYVLYIKPLRLASVGFVWNPLPSMLQLPFVELSKIWRPIVSSGISGSIVTAASAAFNAVMLFKVFTRFGIGKKYSLPIILLYVLNPFIFFYGMNGMSEQIFFVFAIYSVINMTLWMSEGSPEYIVKIAFSLAFAFFCRYEAIPFAAGIGLAVLINIFFNKNEKKFIPASKKHERYYYSEGTAVVLYAPIAYGILIWIFLNWSITGNPFYFLNSVYSNTVQSQLSKPIGSTLGIIKYVAIRSLPFIIPLLGVIIERIATKRFLKSDFFMLFAVVISMIVFHFMMLVKGSSYGWLRFFSYALPITISFIPYEMHEVKKFFRPAVFWIFIFSLITSSVFAAKALSSPVIGVEEHYVLVSNEYDEISDCINNNLSDYKVIMDSFLTSGIILNVNNVGNLIVSSSLNFNKYLRNPVKYGIQYILVPDPDSNLGSLDSFNRVYPNLYKHGEDWCILYKEFDGFKIFKVTD